jgi:hypothetical protein
MTKKWIDRRPATNNYMINGYTVFLCGWCRRTKLNKKDRELRREAYLLNLSSEYLEENKASLKDGPRD